jgi:hypothetical protein
MQENEIFVRVSQVAARNPWRMGRPVCNRHLGKQNGLESVVGMGQSGNLNPQD